MAGAVANQEVQDEETPLLQGQTKAPTSLPWPQLSLLLFLQLGEPLTSQVIYPFAPQLIRDLNITNGDEGKVGYYVGVIESLFFFTQACTVFHWGRLSDRVGRKPVILIGLLGVSISMYCFGLSKTFWGLVVSRALNGALNGNIGIMKSMMAELTDSSNFAKAYAYGPIVWTTGGTIGPIIGGSLSRPAEQFPSLFGNSEFLKKYPYFLPCAVPATYAACAWLITYAFMKETVKHPVSFRSLLFRSGEQQKSDDRSLAGSETTPHSDSEQPVSSRSLMTFRVISAAINFGLLCLVEISFRAMQPLFFSTPVEFGGLGLPPSTIGSILTGFGFLNGFFQIFFFARFIRYWGPKKVFTFGIAAMVPLFLSFPVISYLARTQGFTPALWIAVAIQIILAITPTMSGGAIFMIVNASAPNKASLGAVNGFCQIAGSATRAIGPAMASSLFSLSIENNYLGGNLVYYILVAIVGVSLCAASILPKSI
ncbi:MFS general substrate transporter [Macrolepiota fuliginosa MF-IS2]|uniref:MFS general substrate transporter n=1 Tax=Macrolepiota fuliginosa MF-IS2 TaxID=1400762 RepID=A0A9P5X9G4_9AGAR|nr:MFS general substrate transporter [Macrolepiota fuliginosa MF-IS2]